MLLVLGTISAGLAAWRTEQLRSLAPLSDRGSEELLLAPGELSTSTSATPTPEPAAASRWIDQLRTARAGCKPAISRPSEKFVDPRRR